MARLVRHSSQDITALRDLEFLNFDIDTFEKPQLPYKLIPREGYYSGTFLKKM